jgi:cytidylate kinase
VAPTLTFTGVIAMDGPSGTGKSTVARGVAARLGIRYLDTGAMYRAATLAVLRAGIDPSDRDRVAAAVAGADIEVGTDPASPAVRLDGAGVDVEIRSAAVTAAVSVVSAVPAVRAQLVAVQRRLIEQGPIVVEGRDIGAVVWPAARPKVFLTARPEVRAGRRAAELGPTDGAAVAAVAADIARRDRLDTSRAASPFTQADDAVVVDTSELQISEVINQLVDLAMNPHE